MAMVKITDNATFSQLYQKVAEQRGGDKEISGRKRVTVSADGTVGATWALSSSSSQRRASNEIFAAIDREYGNATATRIFQKVIGGSADQSPAIDLAKLRQFKNELAYEPTARQGDPTSRVPVAFSKVFRQIKTMQESRGLSGSKHLRFKGAKGLYFHETSFGSATGIGNLISGENPVDKREEAGTRIWMSLRNQYDEQTANQVFKNVFGDEVISGDDAKPRVSMNLNQVDKIAAEVARFDPKAVYREIPDDVRERAQIRLDYLRLPTQALNETYQRVAINSTKSKEDDQALQKYLRGGKEVQERARLTKLLADYDLGSGGDDSKFQNLDEEEEFDSLVFSRRKDSSAGLSISVSGDSFDGLSEDLSSGLAKPRTDYQGHADRIYHDNPAVAMRILGDLVYVINNADTLKIGENELEALKSLQMATLDALGLARETNGELNFDKGVTEAEHWGFARLGQLASLLRNAAEKNVSLNKETLDDFRDLLADIGAQFQDRLNQEDEKYARIKQLGADIRELGAGTSAAAKPRQNRLERTGQRLPHDPRAGDDAEAPELTPLAQWHDSRVKLKVINSKIAILSGHEAADVAKQLSKTRQSAKHKIRKLEKKLARLGGDENKEARQEVRAKITGYEAELRRADVTERKTDENRERLIESLGIDGDDEDEVLQALNDLVKQRDVAAEDVRQKLQIHMNDPQTQRMTEQYADLKFKADVDYLDPDVKLNFPLLQARTVHAMRSAVTQGIPMLFSAMDDLDSAD